jgi:hypothetical protein
MDKDFGRLVEVMAEMLEGQRLTRQEMNLTREEINKLRTSSDQNFAKTNLAIGELRLSVMRLADEIVAIHDHENRIQAIEK